MHTHEVNMLFWIVLGIDESVANMSNCQVNSAFSSSLMSKNVYILVQTTFDFDH